MFDVEDLPVKHWAKTILLDGGIDDEIIENKHNITMVYPKRVINIDSWEIKKVKVFTTDLGLQAVDFFAECEFENEIYTQRFRIYSPHFPRVKKLTQYIGSHIVGANMLCTIESKKTQIHVARYIQIIKKDGLKSNPITRSEPSSEKLTYNNQTVQDDSYKTNKILNRKFFKSQFFNDREDSDIFT